MVRYDGQRYLEIADAIKTASRQLRSIDLGAYVSLAVDELRELSGKVAADIERAETRYREAGGAPARLRPGARLRAGLSSQALGIAPWRRRRARVGREPAALLPAARPAGDRPCRAREERWTRMAEDADGDAGTASVRLSSAQQMVHQAIADRDRAATAATNRIVDVVADDSGLSDSGSTTGARMCWPSSPTSPGPLRWSPASSHCWSAGSRSSARSSPPHCCSSPRSPGS